MGKGVTLKRALMGEGVIQCVKNSPDGGGCSTMVEKQPWWGRDVRLWVKNSPDGEGCNRMGENTTKHADSQASSYLCTLSVLLWFRKLLNLRQTILDLVWGLVWTKNPPNSRTWGSSCYWVEEDVSLYSAIVRSELLVGRFKLHSRSEATRFVFCNRSLIM